jgi:uncharacterized SAM-binding protein YcdF (DUF218 family)
MIPGIILGGWVSKGILSENTKKRLDLGVKLLQKGDVNKLILSGGVRKRNGYQELIGDNYSMAEIMKNYILNKGVDENNIILEDLSEETVGQLIFLKQGVLDPLCITEGKIITSDYHKFRVKKELESIFSGNYNFSYSIVKSLNSQKNKSAQLESLNKFFETFRNLDFSKDSEVLSRLLDRHPIYSNSPSFYLKELKKMKGKNSK